MRANWDRIAPLSGVVAVVLWVIGIIVLFDGAPDDDDPAAKAVAYLSDEGQIYAGSWIWALGAVFFLWFLGSLRQRLAAAEGPSGRLAPVAFGAGVAAFALGLAMIAPLLSGAFLEDRLLSEDVALTLSHTSSGIFLLLTFPLLALGAATAIVAFRFRAFPRWFAWLTALFAVIVAVYPIGWIGVIFAFPIWLLVASVTLWRTAPAPARTVVEG